jgi:hypothetical protein
VKERKEANLIQNDRARNISDSGEGEAFVFAPDLDEHRERCTGSTDDAVAGSFGDGSCPMCDLEYRKEGCLQHLAACDGAGDDGGSTTATEPAPTEAARHETDRPGTSSVAVTGAAINTVLTVVPLVWRAPLCNPVPGPPDPPDIRPLQVR